MRPWRSDAGPARCAAVRRPGTGLHPHAQRPYHPGDERRARCSGQPSRQRKHHEPASVDSALVGLELSQESLDDAALSSFVLQALPNNTTGQAGRQGANLGTERGEGLLALRLDLSLAGFHDASRLGLSLLAEFGDDRRTLLAGFLADASSLVTGIGKLLVELCELGVSFGLLRLSGL